MTGEAIAHLVREMARGPSRGRNLTREEAREALSAILAGKLRPKPSALFSC